MASKKIDRKIVDYRVKNADRPPAPANADGLGAGAQSVGESPRQGKAEVIHMHERVERPEVLLGSTYKVKTPLSEHSLYVTINDIVLNPGTEHEQRRPFEVFINSKNMEHFQWIVALTRIISAVFRKGGDVTFLVDELRSVFDPRGGYFKKGGKYMPSLVAEIGDAIESHLRSIGLIQGESSGDALGDAGLQAQRRAARPRGPGASEIPDDARFCEHCGAKAVVRMDNCLTCLSCGDAKCG